VAHGDNREWGDEGSPWISQNQNVGDGQM
jgi:hypothetical protein